MSTLAPERATYTARRQRAEELAERYPFAAEVLRFYAALAPVMEEIAELAHERRPALKEVPSLAAERAMPAVVAATSAAGPEQLAAALQGIVYGTNLEGLAAAWLGGDPTLTASETFLARASIAPILGARPGILTPPPRPTSLLCPACGALPQLSYFAASSEALVTGQRYLLCSRCAHEWVFPRLVCASCGGSDAAQLPIYADHQELPSLRVDGCSSCARYLVTVDVAKDPKAIPAVDELAAIPLGLYAGRRGLKKLATNLMGL